MDHYIRVNRLGLLIGSWRVNVIGSKISDNEDLLCASPAGEQRFVMERVSVDGKDHDRWCGATEEFISKIRVLQEKETAATLHLHPPARNRLLWRVRHAGRNWALRSNYDTAVAELQAEFDAALSAYLARAGDLPSSLEETRRRELARLQLLAPQDIDPPSRRPTTSKHHVGSLSSYYYGINDGAGGGFDGGGFGGFSY
jgi:hypothetical protein